jgi:coenzyme F420-reducing hydrogenase beta subunit
MTAELSDVSVGTVEGKKTWNTVVVRTEMGEKLLRQVKKAGVIETRALPEDNLNHLKEASLLKKRRALDALKERGGIEKAYFTLSADLVKRILSESGEVKP